MPDENYVERVPVPESAVNGGFFDPPEGEPVRVIVTRHRACGERTRVRLPAVVPARLVRRVRCESCAQAYDAEQVEEIEIERLVVVKAPTEPPKARPKLSLPRPSLPSLPKLNPQGRFWRLASIPLAAAAMIAGLLLLQGGDGTPDGAAPGVASAGLGAGEEPASRSGGDAEKSAVSKNSEIVSSSEFSLALPAGWERVDPPSGATFAAVAAEGGADATLWIDEDPKLDFPTFISQSMTQLEALAGGEPEVIERVPGPTPETTIVRLAAASPPGLPTYEVTLRAAGPYRYYLATTIEPDASSEAIAGAELITGSFAPQAEAGQ